MRWLRKVMFWFLYGLFLLLVLAVSDVLLLRGILEYGYPRHWEEDDVVRYPVPYVMFTGKPNTLNYNKYGFPGKMLESASEDDVRVAFFAGSTGVFGDPSIPQVIEDELTRLLGRPVFVANFSVVSSNHRQHLHMMTEHLLDKRVDVVVFYGGYNETIQNAYYDPRPGYPFNFFYRAELSPLRKIVIENSALIGELDRKYHGIFSGLAELRAREKPYSPEWNQKIFNNYFETLDLARRTVGVIDSRLFGKAHFIAFYQPYQVPDEFIPTHEAMRERIATIPYTHDVSTAYDRLGKMVYTDIVHVDQRANDLMGFQIATIIAEEIKKRSADLPERMDQ